MSTETKAKPGEILMVDDDNPILIAFQAYRQELDTKQDRHERIVKLSRDITIESKRIIFLLHSIDSRKNNREKVLDDSEKRLLKLIQTNFKAIAMELQNQDPYQYRWAFSPGLQEFIEAYTFMECLKYENTSSTCNISSWNDLQRNFFYTDIQEDNNQENNERKFSFFLEPTEYMLGLSDIGGELMRRCINALGSGEISSCISTCKILQHLYQGYLGLNIPWNRDMSRKVTTMHQSVLKAENVCYNIKVRGSEASKRRAMFD